MSEQQEPEEPKTDPVFEELIYDISEHFIAADNYAESTLQLSTAEVYQRLQDIYPSMTYSMGEVYSALKELGFKYVDVTSQMNYKWLFIAR